jgi:hypothetical protein
MSANEIDIDLPPQRFSAQVLNGANLSISRVIEKNIEPAGGAQERSFGTVGD